MTISSHCKILITGGQGLVGRALSKELHQQGYENVIALDRKSCDLTNFKDVKTCFQNIKPDVVFHLAASVYGIGGNVKNRASIFLNNILINTHVIEASHQCNTKKIIAMGTVAAYSEPKVLPIKEEHIWDGPPHGSESSYGHAKRAMLAQLLAYQENYGIDFAYVISTNLYGCYDKFHPQTGHVIPSLIRKFYEAKKNQTSVNIWGDGRAERDFLYSKDMAKALVLIMNLHQGPINVASGSKTKIKDIVTFLSGYFRVDNITWDHQMPNGRHFCEIDLKRLNKIGFKPLYTIENGLRETLDWFIAHHELQMASI